MTSFSGSKVNYDIEAGTSKRRNLQLFELRQVMQTLGNTTMALTMETGDVKPLAILYRKYFEAMQISFEPFLASLEGTIQQAVAQRQQQQMQSMQGGAGAGRPSRYTTTRPAPGPARSTA